MKTLNAIILISIIGSPAIANNTLDDLIQEALAKNPMIIAAQAELDAAGTLEDQEASLANPTLKYEGDTDQMETSYEIEQTVPGWGKRKLRRQLAEQEAGIATFELEEARQRLIMEVKESYFMLHGTRLSLEALRQQEDVLKQMDELARARYATASIESIDALKIAAERTMLTQKRLMLAQEETEWSTKLNEVIGRGPMDTISPTVVDPPLTLALDVDRLTTWVFQHNPEYLKYSAMKEQAQKAVALAEKEGAPDWMLGATYLDNDDSEGNTMVMIGMDLPVWRTKTRAMAKEARYDRTAMEAELEAVRRRLASEVQSIGLCCTRVQEAVKLYQTDLLPQAQQRFDATQAAYSSGRADFMDLLEAQRFWLEAQIMSAMAEADLNIEIARLESILGTSLSIALGGEIK